MGSYPLSSQAPAHVEVELGCDNMQFIDMVSAGRIGVSRHFSKNMQAPISSPVLNR